MAVKTIRCVLVPTNKKIKYTRGCHLEFYRIIKKSLAHLYIEVRSNLFNFCS